MKHTLSILLSILFVQFSLAHQITNRTSNDNGKLTLISFDAWNDIDFVLYTKFNNKSGQRIKLGNLQQLRASSFNAYNPTRITIHGWLGGLDSSVNQLNREAYLGRGDFNVISVDWSRGAGVGYVLARMSVNSIGAVVAAFVDSLRDNAGLRLSDLTVIGHSLGAHVAGITGKRITNGTIECIVGLDPALPLFPKILSSERLSANDANYVQIVTTNSGNYGYDEPIGHASFYPNWGNNQPRCNEDDSCSHSRAVDYFVESVRHPGTLIGTQCAGYRSIVLKLCSPMGKSQQLGGEPLNSAAKGVYYLKTNGMAPWGQGY